MNKWEQSRGFFGSSAGVSGTSAHTEGLRPASVPGASPALFARSEPVPAPPPLWPSGVSPVPLASYAHPEVDALFGAMDRGAWASLSRLGGLFGGGSPRVRPNIFYTPPPIADPVVLQQMNQGWLPGPVSRYPHAFLPGLFGGQDEDGGFIEGGLIGGNIKKYIPGP